MSIERSSPKLETVDYDQINSPLPGLLQFSQLDRHFSRSLYIRLDQSSIGGNTLSAAELFDFSEDEGRIITSVVAFNLR